MSAETELDTSEDGVVRFLSPLQAPIRLQTENSIFQRVPLTL